MTQRSLAVLVVLNVVLLAALSVTVFNPQPAEAQFAAARQYTMIAGGVTGRSNQSAIYVIDLSSSRIAPLFYNGSNDRFEFFAGRSVSRDMQRIGDNR